jgi:hypothetical protein
MPLARPQSLPVEVLDAEFLACAPEIYIFSACLGTVKQVWALEQKLNNHEIDHVTFIQRVSPLFTELWGLAEATQRFGIVVPFTPQIAFSPFFWRWFNWWYDYRESLAPKQLEHIRRLQRNFDPAVLDHRPAGDWLIYRATPPFGFKFTPVVKN